jgi:hypothetical protein
MRRTVIAAILCTVVLFGWGSVDAEETNSPTQQVRLELGLVDGSRVVGVPKMESVPLQTAYATMNIPLKGISTLRMDEDHENAAVEMRNGDKLKGVVSLKPVTLATVFGEAKIGVEHIRELRVVLSGGPLPEALRKGLVLYYSFDRDEGAMARDQSGTGNDGETHGTKWTPEGRLGGACCFNGSEHIDIGNEPSLNIKSAITMAAWVLPRQSTGDHPIIAKEGAGGRQTYWFGIYQGRFGLLLGGGGGWGLDARAFGNIPTDKWQHLAVTWNGADYSCYCNGAIVGTGRYSAQVPSSAAPVQIGQNSEFASTHFSGMIDEVMIFDRALSDVEVKQIYDAQK